MRLVSVLFALAGAGSLGVGIFPENIIIIHGVPVPHTIAAITTFVAGGAAAIASYRITKSLFRYFSIVLGIATLVGLRPLFRYGKYGLFRIGRGRNGENDRLSNASLECRFRRKSHCFLLIRRTITDSFQATWFCYLSS